MLYTPKLGAWRPDDTQLGDHDDYNFDALASKLVLTESSNTNVDLRKFSSPVEDQGHVGSCVGNAVVGALELLRIKAGLPHTDLSRLFVYYNSRLMHQQQDRDEGTFIRLAMGTLSSLGTCTEEKWPYDPSKVFIRPSWGAYRMGYANKIDSYYKIGGSGKTRLDYIKQALRAQCPVVFGMTIDDAYIKTGSDGMVAMPKQARINPGGHAQLIVGFNDNTERLIVRNSWGKFWCDSGHAHVPYEYLDAADARDFWVPQALI